MGDCRKWHEDKRQGNALKGYNFPECKPKENPCAAGECYPVFVIEKGEWAREKFRCECKGLTASEKKGRNKAQIDTTLSRFYSPNPPTANLLPEKPDEACHVKAVVLQVPATGTATGAEVIAWCEGTGCSDTKTECQVGYYLVADEGGHHGKVLNLRCFRAPPK